ncbi:hypothetical protein CC1G_14357 [Coprinopsis cinerea okayama7|uniref:CxC1-like cysteine cluster associated with KDZ transposases domain-containing protein n=1 Tax=Coprinopsis cinerea (strain Okayama-7 / 130 / ATCC MYA-4618 / FGSC 9003) TaxID=240176 RepID=D6RM06_COPC7|nr:hypothetical protein CC1G_14357 [Coprinopsis cinerea okayama7\|eukprot:XP_002911358.1 hypothetical protein CC1G_14357 [Coprinopsis cinerea okayama7\
MKHPGESNINLDAFVASDVDDSEHRIFTASISPGSTPARNTRGQTRGRLRTPPSPPKPRPRGRHAKKPKLVEVPVSEQPPQRSPSPDPFLAPPGTTGLMSTPAPSTSVHAPPSSVSASMPTTISSSSSPQDPPSVVASMDTGLLSTVSSSSSVLAPPSSIAPSFASTLSSASSTHEPPSSFASTTLPSASSSVGVSLLTSAAPSPTFGGQSLSIGFEFCTLDSCPGHLVDVYHTYTVDLGSAQRRRSRTVGRPLFSISSGHMVQSGALHASVLDSYCGPGPFTISIGDMGRLVAASNSNASAASCSTDMMDNIMEGVDWDTVGSLVDDASLAYAREFPKLMASQSSGETQDVSMEGDPGRVDDDDVEMGWMDDDQDADNARQGTPSPPSQNTAGPSQQLAKQAPWDELVDDISAQTGIVASRVRSILKRRLEGKDVVWSKIPDTTHGPEKTKQLLESGLRQADSAFDIAASQSGRTKDSIVAKYFKTYAHHRQGNEWNEFNRANGIIANARKAAGGSTAVGLMPSEAADAYSRAKDNGDLDKKLEALRDTLSTANTAQMTAVARRNLLESFKHSSSNLIRTAERANAAAIVLCVGAGIHQDQNFIHLDTSSGLQGFLEKLTGLSTDDILGLAHGHIAGQGTKVKTNTQVYDDTGTMAMVCRHDYPLFLANIDTPGEQQKYAVALIKKLFTMIPPNATVVAFYDVGCVLDRSLQLVSLAYGIWRQYEILPESITSRLEFCTSAMHAYAHQWACQLYYNPRFQDGTGNTNGEGTERLWAIMRKLIAIARMSSRSRRLWLINQLMKSHRKGTRQNLGKWVKTQRTAIAKQIPEQQSILQKVGIPITELRSEWQDQREKQLSIRGHQPTRLKQQLDEVLRIQADIDRIDARIEAMAATVQKADDDDDPYRSILHNMKVTRQNTLQKMEQHYESLNVGDAYPELRGMDYKFVKTLLLMRDLKINIRKRAIAQFLEFDQLNQAYGGKEQPLGTNLHQLTRKAIENRQPALMAAIERFNTHRAQLVKLIKPEWGIVLPRELPVNLTELRDHSDLMEDVWLTPATGGAPPPRWLESVDVRRGIRAMLTLERCQEEIVRLNLEADNMCRWYGREIASVEVTIRETPSRPLSRIPHVP